MSSVDRKRGRAPVASSGLRRRPKMLGVRGSFPRLHTVLSLQNVDEREKERCGRCLSQVKTWTMTPENGPAGGPGSGEMLTTYRQEAVLPCCEVALIVIKMASLTRSRSLSWVWRSMMIEGRDIKNWCRERPGENKCCISPLMDLKTFQRDMR
jgi:hypothetical protein